MSAARTWSGQKTVFREEVDLHRTLRFCWVEVNEVVVARFDLEIRGRRDFFFCTPCCGGGATAGHCPNCAVAVTTPISAHWEPIGHLVYAIEGVLGAHLDPLTAFLEAEALWSYIQASMD